LKDLKTVSAVYLEKTFKLTENVTVMYSTGLVLPLCVTHEVRQNPINLTHMGLHGAKVSDILDYQTVPVLT